MKCAKIVKALDKILYLIEKKGIFYRGTQEHSCNQWHLLKSRKFINDCSASCRLLYFTIWAHPFTITKRLSYLSPTSQNKLIGIVAKYIIQKRIFLQTKLLASVYCITYIFMKQQWLIVQLKTQYLGVKRPASRVSVFN